MIVAFQHLHVTLTPIGRPIGEEAAQGQTEVACVASLSGKAAVEQTPPLGLAPPSQTSASSFAVVLLAGGRCDVPAGVDLSKICGGVGGGEPFNKTRHGRTEDLAVVVYSLLSVPCEFQISGLCLRPR
jgi:hypothetical protein